MTIAKSFLESHGVVPDVVLSGMTIPQLEALGAPSGKITPEQAMDLINERREAKGLGPIHYLP